MKVLIMNTYSCCHQDQFMGVFESEEKAKEALLDMAIKQYGEPTDWQRDVKVWLDKDDKYTDDYVIYKKYFYKDTDTEMITKINCYYRIEDVKLNELY